MTTLIEPARGPGELPRHLREQFAAVLARHGLDRPARDGDCQVVAARVTAALWKLGIAATTVDVLGWVTATKLGFPGDHLVMIFQHRATLAGGWLLDATAQQFHPDLPQCWTAPAADYLQQLAAATGVDSATLAGGAP